MLLKYYKILLQLLRVGFGIYILYYYGFYGLVFMLISLYSFYYLLKVKFGLHTLSSGDYLFVDWRKYNMVQVTEFETFDKEKISQDIYDKGIKVFPRLRQKLHFMYVDWFFKDVPLEEAKKQIKIINDVKIKTDYDITQYGNKMAQKYFKEGEIQVEFQLIEKEGGGGLLFIIFDHVITDGTGMLGILGSITSNKEKNLESQAFSISWSIWLYSLVWFPVFFFHCCFRHIYTIPSISKPSAFKSDKEFTDIALFAKTRNFNLDKAKIFIKSLGKGFTFNDFVLAVISVSIQKYHKSINKYTDNEYYTCAVPVNTKSIPKNIRETRLENEASGVLATIPISDSINADLLKSIHLEMAKTAKDIRYIYTVKYINFFCSTVTPKFVWDMILMKTLNSLDINISNVPGPSFSGYVGDCKVLQAFVVPPIGAHKVFMGAQSYKGDFCLTFRCDTSIECEPNKFIQIMEDVIENYIK